MSSIATTESFDVVIGHVAQVEGKTATARSLSILANASSQATSALVANGGKVGKLAALRVAEGGLVSIAKAASHANYRPAAEYFAATFGETFVIRKRADFEALPSMMEARVIKAQSAKNGGMRVGKDGIAVPGAALARAMRMHNIAVQLVDAAQAMFTERLAAAVERRETVSAE